MASLHLLLLPLALVPCASRRRAPNEGRFKTRSAVGICVSLPSFLMDAQRGERKSIIDGVFIWSFMLELKTDEELKRWPDFSRRRRFQGRERKSRDEEEGNFGFQGAFRQSEKLGGETGRTRRARRSSCIP